MDTTHTPYKTKSSIFKASLRVNSSNKVSPAVTTHLTLSIY